MMRDFKPEAYVSVINRILVSGKSISHDTERGGGGRGKGGHIRFRRDYNEIKSSTQPLETLTIWQLIQISIEPRHEISNNLTF